MPTPTRPKLLPAALASAMQDRGVNQVQLSQRSGIAVSRVNNYLQGKYRTIKPAHLEAISSGLGGTPADNATLIQAYLYDLLPDDCRGLVDVRVLGAKETGRWEVPSKDLSKAFAGALRDLYVLCVSNVKVRQRTADWIEIMRGTKG